jgi:quercetin dioxygenase-like cupin family protein
MKKIAMLLVLPLGIPLGSIAQDKVEIRGIKASVKLEEVVYGHLAQLNGKYKLRATELTLEPGAFLGGHHHAGPGIRYVVSGEVTFAQAGKSMVYKQGSYFFETGNVIHTAQNRTKSPVRIIFFEILPSEWSGPTVIPPKAH